MLNKAATIGCCAGARTKPHFERRKRAGDTQPSLCHDNRDSNEVYQSERQYIDPRPTPKIADNDDNHAANDEGHHSNMQREKGIRQQLIQEFVAHSVSGEPGVFLPGRAAPTSRNHVKRHDPPILADWR